MKIDIKVCCKEHGEYAVMTREYPDGSVGFACRYCDNAAIIRKESLQVTFGEGTWEVGSEDRACINC